MIIEWFSKCQQRWFRETVTKEEFERIKKFHSVRIVEMDLMEDNNER